LTNGGGRRRRVPVAPRPRGPLIEFAPLDAEVAGLMQEAQREMGITKPLGPRIAGYKPKSRWAGAEWKGGGSGGNLWMHPLRLLARFFGYKKVGYFTKAGRAAYKKDLRVMRRGEALRETTGIIQRMEAERLAYENAVRAALNALKGGVAASTVNEHNAGFHMQQYRDAVDAARTAFREKIAQLKEGYRTAAAEAGVIKKSRFKY